MTKNEICQIDKEYWSKDNISYCDVKFQVRNCTKEKVQEIIDSISSKCVSGGYCSACQHDISVETPFMGGTYTQHYCKLNCNCGRFEERQED